MLPEELLKLPQDTRGWQGTLALALDKGPISQVIGSRCLVLHKCLQ